MKKERQNCIKCGRKLKTHESKQLGMGPICYLKYLKEKDTPRLFDAKSVSSVQKQ